MPTGRADAPRERGSAVVDFCLVMVLLVPLFLGIVQVGLVLHVRNTLTSAASDGARHAAAFDGSTVAGAQRTRDQINDTVGARYTTDVVARQTMLSGVPAVEVRVRASVPALGLFGPEIDLEVDGHAVRERLP